LKPSDLLRALFHRPKPREALHAYWKAPDEANRPEAYVRGGHERSAFLVEVIRRHAAPAERILEIGCNAGRNLDHLFRAGYTRLAGLELSENAVRLLRATYPDMARQTALHVGALEDRVRGFANGEFDLVYTMAVLEHIHTDSDWVFGEIARIARRTLVTIEDEREASWRHFPRNYRKVFERLGLRQVEEAGAVPGLSRAFVLRVFRK
jgi:SAM-dependent methyltransferase